MLLSVLAAWSPPTPSLRVSREQLNLQGTTLYKKGLVSALTHKQEIPLGKSALMAARGKAMLSHECQINCGCPRSEDSMPLDLLVYRGLALSADHMLQWMDESPAKIFIVMQARSQYKSSFPV